MATDIITAIQKILPGVLKLRRITYSTSIQKLAPELRIEYWTTDSAPPNTINNVFELQTFTTTQNEMDDYRLITAAYTNTGVNGHLNDFTRKACTPVLYLSLKADEWDAYNASKKGQIDSSVVTTKIKKCSSDTLSDGWSAKSIVNAIAGMTGVQVKIMLPDYHIRQYKITTDKSVMSVIRDLFGFFRPQFHVDETGALVVDSEKLTTFADDIDDEYYFNIFAQYGSLEYTKQKLREVSGNGVKVVVYGGLAPFNAAEAGVLTGPQDMICLATTATTTGHETLTIACYKVDELGRKVLIRTHEYEYDYTIPASASLNKGGLIREETRYRHYNYDDITYESPILQYESISGQKAILVTDETGKAVMVGSPSDISGFHILKYDSSTHELLHSIEDKVVSIWPVTINNEKNKLVTERSTTRTAYHRSGGKVFAVSTARTSETPVFSTALSANTSDGINTEVSLNTINYSTNTNVSEAFGDVQRNYPKKRQMQIRKEAGASGGCVDAFEISNSNIVVPGEAQHIANFIASSQSSATASHVVTLKAALYEDTIYPIGTTFKTEDGQIVPGCVVAQEIDITMGDGVTGFNFQNVVTIQAKYRVD